MIKYELCMLGLIFTSASFLVPAWMAWCKHRWWDAAAAGALTTTSLAYHGTLHPLAHTIDKSLAHGLGFTYALVGLHHHRRLRWVMVPFCAGIGIYVFVTNGSNAPYWHMSFHILEQIAWIGRIYVDS
jgi:hypothetical protein